MKRYVKEFISELKQYYKFTDEEQSYLKDIEFCYSQGLITGFDAVKSIVDFIERRK